MAPSSQQKPAGITGFLVLALILTLLGGAVLIRFVDIDEPTLAPSTQADKSQETVKDTAVALPREGHVAPDFTLADPDGQRASLSDWDGRPVLVNFWATWCGPCEVEMPAIQAAYETHQDNGLVVLAVAVDDSVKNVRRFFEKHHLTFQPLMDDGTVSRVYQVFGLPTSFFVAADGKITAVHAGALTESKIEEYLTRVLAQD